MGPDSLTKQCYRQVFFLSSFFSPPLLYRLPFGVSSRVNVDCYGALTKLLDKMLFPTKDDDPGDEGKRTEEISPD